MQKKEVYILGRIEILTSEEDSITTRVFLGYRDSVLDVALDGFGDPVQSFVSILQGTRKASVKWEVEQRS